MLHQGSGSKPSQSQNHNKGLRIEESDLALYALEPWEVLVEDEVIDEKFFRDIIKYAISHRTNLGFDTSTRLIFAEADYLPGFIVDKYGDYLCLF